MVAFSIEDYVYHTLAAKASGELCLKYIFSFGAFARMPLLHRSVDVSLSMQCYFFVFLEKKKFEEVFPLVRGIFMPCYSSTQKSDKALKPLHNLIFSSVQCVRVESANHFYIWPRRLDELSRGSRSSQAYEGPL